jgi:hypothetical protein
MRTASDDSRKRIDDILLLQFRRSLNLDETFSPGSLFDSRAGKGYPSDVPIPPLNLPLDERRFKLWQ